MSGQHIPESSKGKLAEHVLQNATDPATWHSAFGISMFCTVMGHLFGNMGSGRAPGGPLIPPTKTPDNRMSLSGHAALIKVQIVMMLAATPEDISSFLLTSCIPTTHKCGSLPVIKGVTNHGKKHGCHCYGQLRSPIAINRNSTYHRGLS